MELSLTKLPWYAQVGAYVVLAGVGVGVFYQYVEVPARAEMASRQTRLKSRRADIAFLTLVTGALVALRIAVEVVR